VNEADLVFSGISIFSKSLFNNQRKEYFRLFQDFIFKKRMNENNILTNINGIEYKDKIYVIDTIDSLLKTNSILW
jgi:NDP-sugar pyrophosphorylase family protein